MIEILIITVAILTLLIVALITFIFYQNKNNKTPEFVTLRKEITIKDDYITELKKDKQLLIDNSKNADDFKDCKISTKFRVKTKGDMKKKIMACVGH